MPVLVDGSRARRRALASVTAVVFVAASIVMPTAASAADAAALRNTKSASVANVTPGQAFNWVIEVGCSVLTDECVNAVLTDTIPSEFIVGNAAGILLTGAIVPAEFTTTVTGQLVRIDFLQDLASPVGLKGLRNGIVTITIPVTVRADLDYTLGRTVTNTSLIVAENAPDVASQASVSLAVPLQLATVATKVFAPASNITSAGVPTTLTLGGSNSSNAAVDTLVIQDPVNPSALPNIFGSTVRLQSPLGAVTWPTGATEATVALWNVGVGWVSAPPVAAGGTLVFPSGVTMDDTRGVRITFSSGGTAAIPRSASASFPLSLQNRTGLAPGTVSNTAQSSVRLGAAEASTPVTAGYTLIAANTVVTAGKTIVPNRLATTAFGASDATAAVVTLSAANGGSVSLKSLAIAEPTNPAAFNDPGNPLSPAHQGGGLVFAGFGAVVWPSGANAVAITFYYADGSSATGTSSTVNTMPASASLARVTGFRVEFAGVMPQGATATVPYRVTANPAQVAPNLRVNYSNTIGVAGTSVYDAVAPTVQATATASVFADQLSITTAKSNTHPDLPSLPGQATTATLTGTILGYPETTRSTTRVEIVDPSVESGMTEWYRYFNATQLTATQVPGGSTLTVQYRDSAGGYADIPGLVGLAPGTHTLAFPVGLLDSIYGVRLVWVSSTGFAPGSSFTANLRYALRSTLRESATPLPNAELIGALVNCSAAVASTTAGGPATSNRPVSPTCPVVNLRAVPPGGGADLLDKDFLNTGNNTSPQDIIGTRNSNRTRVRLSWSTGGYNGVARMEVYDGPVDGAGDPAPTLWNQKGMFDAFNLVNIPSISTALDPLLQYDRVGMELFNRTTNAWETPSGWCSVAVPCATTATTGTVARALSATQQDTTVAVRFVFTEKAGRTGLAPAAGSGVASSTVHNRRIDLEFELRGALRSSPSTPVVNGYQYNLPVAGASRVLNGAYSEAFLSTQSVRDRASDTIALQDPNLAVDSTKAWAGGTLPIPDASTVGPQPSSRVTLTGVNQTPAIVGSLTVQEPNPGAALPNDSPFDEFDLGRFVSITHPSGSTGLTITVVRSVGGTLLATGTTAAATATALAWTPAQLATATAFTAVHTGAIARVNGTSTIVIDLVLRRFHRGDPTLAVSMADSPVFNSTQATVADLRFDPASSTTAPTFIDATLSDRAGASKTLQESTISVTTTKSFSPATQTEPVRTPIVTVLAAIPGGSERISSITITDDRATFWNGFDFVALAAGFTLPTFNPAPAGSGTVVRVDACIGRTWTAVDIVATPDATCTATGGSWVIGTPKTQAQAIAGLLPTGVTPAQVQGLRFTVSRADGSQWENPHAPTISVPLAVQRRISLRSGGEVLTTYASNAAAPGETARGVTTNAVTSMILGVWGKSASSTALATYTYRHAPSGIEVRKTPTGAKAPGQLFDYTLTVRNTGSWPIVNPVITDYLPTDVAGALLVFDPDKPWTYRYALSGAAPIPGTGTPLPTGTSGPTVTVVPNGPGPETIRFTFPPSSVLEVGQSYVITVPMMFRPGLTYSTSVTNVFGITGDRVFDTCTAPAGHVAVLNSAGECRTGTTVQPAQQPALRAFMSVKAVTDAANGFPDQGFTGGSQSACTASLDPAGFSRLPCIPLTLPGQRETWRMTAQNTGTTEMPRLVLATRLPSFGDQTILDGFLRRSAWTAGFADVIVAELGIAGATMGAFYTTAASPCSLVLQTPDNLGVCGSAPTTGWAPWVAGTIDPATVTGLQFVLDFPVTHYLRPGETITIDIQTVTAALSATPGADTTANNSLSASARSITGNTLTTVTALDYSRVSVGLATGSVTLDKAITGAGASFVPAGQTFTGELRCTSLSDVTTRPFTFTFTGTTVSPASIQFDDLPGGARCTATETATSGQSGYTATTVIVNPLAAPTSLPRVSLVNEYRLAGLTVGKTVTSAASVVPAGFGFTVECTFLGQTLALGADAAFLLDEGDIRTITGLPARATCTVVETNDQGADGTIITGQTAAANGGAFTVDDPNRTVVFTLSPDTTAGLPSNSVDFDNRFNAPAALVIDKNFRGGAAQQFGSGNASFTVRVVCVFGSTTPAQFDGDVLLLADNGWRATLGNMIAGSTCTITEPDTQGADAVVIVPNDGSDASTGTVTVPATASPIVTVDVANWYLTGSLDVTKTFAGDRVAIDKFGADPRAGYEFSLVCLRDGLEVDIPGGALRTVTALQPVASYTALASGALCTVTETDSGGASSSRTLSAAAELPAGQFLVDVAVPRDLDDLDEADQAQPEVEIENTFRLATVSAGKTVRSGALDERGAPVDYGEVQLRLTCMFDGRGILPLESSTRSVKAGGAVTWTELAEGAECSIEETDTRGAGMTQHALVTTAGVSGPTENGTTAELAPLRWTGEPAANAVGFVNLYTLAYTGSSPGWRMPGLSGLLILAGVALVWFARRPRNASGLVTPRLAS